MTHTIEEVHEAIKKFGHQDFVDSIEYTTVPFELPGIGTVKQVAAETGGEGSAEHIWIVFEIDGTLYEKTGYYSSYDGTEWSYGTLSVVVPRQTIVTVYDRVK